MSFSKWIDAQVTRLRAEGKPVTVEEIERTAIAQFGLDGAWRMMLAEVIEDAIAHNVQPTGITAHRMMSDEELMRRLGMK